MAEAPLLIHSHLANKKSASLQVDTGETRRGGRLHATDADLGRKEHLLRTWSDSGHQGRMLRRDKGLISLWPLPQWFRRTLSSARLSPPATHAGGRQAVVLSFGILASSVSSRQKYDRLAVGKCQGEGVSANPDRSADVGQIPFQNYSSAALNTKYTGAIGRDFEIPLLCGNFYPGSSCRRFDLYRTFPGSRKIPFPSTPFPLRKEVSQENIQNIVLSKVLKYESFSSARKTLLPPLFCIIICFA